MFIKDEKYLLKTRIQANKIEQNLNFKKHFFISIRIYFMRTLFYLIEWIKNEKNNINHNYRVATLSGNLEKSKYFIWYGKVMKMSGKK